MNEKYTVLSPWAEPLEENVYGLTERLDSLEGKTIGLYAHFKGQVVAINNTLERVIHEQYPGIRTKKIQFKKDTTEIKDDPAFYQELKAWLEDVDAVIVAYGDAGSCSMVLGYNAAYIEKHFHKPVVMLCKDDLATSARRGVRSRCVPELRMVYSTIMGSIPMRFGNGFVPMFPEGFEEGVVLPEVRRFLPELLDALVRPLTEAERYTGRDPKLREPEVISGSYRHISDYFYRKGWTNGSPMVLPTEENVAEMLRGTDLPRDHVVGVLPPRKGKATVEKIAVNAVMAGCLPTYLPLLIAAVEGMLDKDTNMSLEGWTCSVNGCGPLVIINGPIRNDINMNCRGNALSPFWKPNATIGRAIAYILMNIAGIRPNCEDMSEMGHEIRHGLVIGENEEENPWGEPIQTDYGFRAEDSTITLFWTQQRQNLNARGNSVTAIRGLVNVRSNGYRPGCAFVISPKFARLLKELFPHKQDVYDYLVEFSRKTGDANLMARMNNHPPLNNVPLAVSPEVYTRQYFSDDHLLLLVAGSDYGESGVAFTGGGDHGGPPCKKVRLPKNWEALVAEYKDLKPEYEDY